MEDKRELTIPLSTVIQLAGYLIGGLWIITQTVRDVTYMRAAITEKIAPSILELNLYREGMTKRVDEFMIVYDSEKKALWVEIQRLREDLNKLEEKIKD